jgi:hypothetical protein
MQFWKIAGLMVTVSVVLFVLDRWGLWMERQGWIYWRKNKGMSTRLGNAFLELHSMLEPSKRHVVESGRTKNEIKLSQATQSLQTL